MPKVELDKVEEYLVEQATENPGRASRIGLIVWIRQIFAELRSREDAKAFM